MIQARTAVVHDWLTVYAGAERVLEQILRILPDADIYSTVDFLAQGDRAFLGGKHPKTSFIQNLPFAKRHYRSYLPLMPLAVEQFDLSGYDLIVSSSHAVAKGVITGPDQLHVSVCYSPMRYAWDLQAQYLEESGLSRGLKGAFARTFLHYLRIWDARSSQGVDTFVAISEFVARRIKKAYRRDAHVIYPPVDVDRFQLVEEKDDYYVTMSRLVPYKRVDAIVSAFGMMPQRQLKVIGTGPELGRIRGMAPKNVDVLGFIADEPARDLISRARAFLFAAEEDFGIAPVEAMAAGTPVLAYGKGGARETVKEGVSGMFFLSRDSDAIIAAVDDFESRRADFAPSQVRKQAERFSMDRFESEFRDFLESEYRRFRGE